MGGKFEDLRYGYSNIVEFIMIQNFKIVIKGGKSLNILKAFSFDTHLRVTTRSRCKTLTKTEKVPKRGSKLKCINLKCQNGLTHQSAHSIL